MKPENPLDDAPRQDDYDRAMNEINSEKSTSRRLRGNDFEDSSFSDNNHGMLSKGFGYIGNRLAKGFQVIKDLPYIVVAPLILSAAIGVTSGVLSFNNETYRDSKKQLGFSEISQIMDDVREGHLVPVEGKDESSTGMARTLYQAGLNDLTMKIIEDSNLAHEDIGDFYAHFADRLKDRLDPAKKKHRHELNELFDMVNGSSQTVRQEYSKLMQIRNALPSISNLFNASWTEKHDDNFHTVWETVEHTSTDDKGHTTTYTTLESHQVYDDTDHYYYYHPEKGNQASTTLDNLIATSGDITIKEPYFKAKKIKEQNKAAVLKSRTEKVVPKLSESDLLGIVNTWHDGSTLVLNELGLYPNWDNLSLNSREWDSVKSDAKYHHYNTTSTTHSGPLEYRVAYKTRDQIDKVNKLLDESIKVLDYNDKNLPVLRTKINQFVETHNAKERKKLGNEVLALTQEIYQTNFKKGFEVDRFRTGMIVLWSFLGTFLGAGAGVGLGYGIDRLKQDRLKRDE